MLFLLVVRSEDDSSFIIDLYTEHGNYLYATAFKILKESNQAEDALHNAFVKIMENIDRIMEIPCHKRLPYVVIVVKNQALTQYQKLKKHPVVDLAEMQYGLADNQNIEDAAIQTEELESLIAHVDSLSDELRLPLLLRYAEDMPHKKIAELLDISEALSRKRVQRAVEALRSKMGRKD